ncbi:MAG: hypothetical protein AUK17_00575 [Parcubacteria group bacterium CG2_30_44_18]|nr:MAG: hypothetical protein AUK17_00575 [Parcubacteria group bacterium CG2_30_44_18]
MLPDLRTREGFDALREAGYGFSVFDRPQNFKMQAGILELAVKTAGSLSVIGHIFLQKHGTHNPNKLVFPGTFLRYRKKLSNYF